jgi:two-component system CheB/CheR fusion protein
MERLRPNFIVGIGGSAGGLNAYKALLNALPPNTGMAFVFIAHLNPTANSQLVQILSRHTKMLVILAGDAMPIRANHVYVIPPNADISIEGYSFKIVTPRAQRNRQIDLFLTSLAEAMGPHAIGVILSGYDGDGSEGCKKIKELSGTTFAQDKSAEVDNMPLSAKATGCVDFVLPVDKISEELQKLASSSSVAKKKKRLSKQKDQSKKSQT